MTQNPVAQELAELLPCPFCGGKADHRPLVTYFQVECASCCARINRPRLKAEDAEADWNRRAFTQATGAGLPELEPLTYSPCTYLGQDGKTVYSMTPTNYGEWMRVSDYRRAATALQERADATARQRDAECERANELAARLKFDKTFEQHADNLQRELTEARDCIRDVRWPDLVSDRDHGWGLRHAKAIAAARSERGGG